MSEKDKQKSKTPDELPQKKGVADIRISIDPVTQQMQGVASEVQNMFVTAAAGQIDYLLEKVEAMRIASRFSREAKPYENMGRPPDWAGYTRDMNEAEYKRFQLQRELLSVRNEVLRLGDRINMIMMDMQMTQLDYPGEEVDDAAEQEKPVSMLQRVSSRLRSFLRWGDS